MEDILTQSDEICCPECGKPIKKNAATCPHCEVRIKELKLEKPGIIITPKHKSIAILLSVFLSFFSWLYTYKKNSKKFWISFIIAAITPVIIAMLWQVTGRVSSTAFNAVFLCSVLFGIWIWAIIDNSIKSKIYFSQYPKG